VLPVCTRTLASNHVASLLDCLERDPAYGFVYSGLIKVEDEPGHYVTGTQFAGPAGKVIEERRQIFALKRRILRTCCRRTT
jgi:hypothetical protein